MTVNQTLTPRGRTQLLAKREAELLPTLAQPRPLPRSKPRRVTTKRLSSTRRLSLAVTPKIAVMKIPRRHQRLLLPRKLPLLKRQPRRTSLATSLMKAVTKTSKSLPRVRPTEPRLPPLRRLLPRKTHLQMKTATRATTVKTTSPRRPLPESNPMSPTRALERRLPRSKSQKMKTKKCKPTVTKATTRSSLETFPSPLTRMQSETDLRNTVTLPTLRFPHSKARARVLLSLSSLAVLRPRRLLLKTAKSSMAETSRLISPTRNPLVEKKVASVATEVETPVANLPLSLLVTSVSEPLRMALEISSPHAVTSRMSESPWEMTVELKVLPMLNSSPQRLPKLPLNITVRSLTEEH
jgi:hypothetical protein